MEGNIVKQENITQLRPSRGFRAAVFAEVRGYFPCRRFRTGRGGPAVAALSDFYPFS